MHEGVKNEDVAHFARGWRREVREAEKSRLSLIVFICAETQFIKLALWGVTSLIGFAR